MTVFEKGINLEVQNFSIQGDSACVIIHGKKNVLKGEASMGLRFRKSINIGPIRLNFSKSGIGYSIGKKGIRLTKTATGRTKATVSLPGTGLSYEHDLTSSSKKKKTRAKKKKD